MMLKQTQTPLRKLSILLLLFFCSFAINMQAQDGEIIRCLTVEAENARLDDKYQEFLERFEAFIARERANLNRHPHRMRRQVLQLQRQRRRCFQMALGSVC